MDTFEFLTTASLQGGVLQLCMFDNDISGITVTYGIHFIASAVLVWVSFSVIRTIRTQIVVQ